MKTKANIRLSDISAATGISKRNFEKWFARIDFPFYLPRARQGVTTLFTSEQAFQLALYGVLASMVHPARALELYSRYDECHGEYFSFEENFVCIKIDVRGISQLFQPMEHYTEKMRRDVALGLGHGFYIADSNGMIHREVCP